MIGRISLLGSFAYMNRRRRNMAACRHIATSASMLLNAVRNGKAAADATSVTHFAPTTNMGQKIDAVLSDINLLFYSDIAIMSP